MDGRDKLVDGGAGKGKRLYRRVDGRGGRHGDRKPGTAAVRQQRQTHTCLSDKAPNFVQSSKAAPASRSVNNKCHKEVTNMANEIKTWTCAGPIPHWSRKSRRRRRTKRRVTSASASATSRTWSVRQRGADERGQVHKAGERQRVRRGRDEGCQAESGSAWLNAAKGDADKSGMGGVKNDGGNGGRCGQAGRVHGRDQVQGKKQ